MGVTLPADLAGLLNEAGGRWPQADEDRLRELAGSWRALSADLRAAGANGATAAGNVTAANTGTAVDAFSAYWKDLHGDIEKAAMAADQVAVGVATMASASLGAKKAIAGALQSTHSKIQSIKSVAVVGPVAARFLGPLIRLLLQFIIRILGALFKLIWKGIVWLFKKIADFFKWLWNKIFGKKKPAPPPKPTYPRTGKLPHARDLIKNGKEFKGRKLPNKSDPNSVLYKRDPQTGQVTNYTVYDDAGNAIKRVDLTGRSHGGVPTPHTVEYTVHRNPSGEVFVRENKMVRPSTPEEIP